jgi:nucleoid-associated protein YgaU
VRRVALTIALLAGATSLLAATVAARADRVHVVRPGESLWRIAATATGDPALWPLLYRANRDQIKDPSLLYPGQRLTIPDLDETPAVAGAPAPKSTKLD